MIQDRDPQSNRPDFLTSGFNPEPGEDLERLRQLLFGKELQDLAELRRRLDALGLTPEDLAEHLPEAIALRSGQDTQLGRALGPTMDKAFEEAVQRNPDRISNAIFPILGPAIRKSIAATMAQLVQSINRTIEHSLSWNGLRWRWEAMRSGVPYGEVVIKHSLVYRVDQVFLVERGTGLLLRHVSGDGTAAEDADVISGMLTAIKDFVQDSFEADDTDGLRRVSVAQHTIHAVQGPRAMICAVVRGMAPEELDNRLQDILERVHLQYGQALASFDGDTAALEPADPLLSEALETVVSSDLPGKKSSATRVAWIAAGAVALLAGVFFVRAHLRWSGAVTALDQTPGIVVISSDRSLRGGHVEGMVDPLAASPGTVLAEHGLDTTRVTGAWEPYVSLHPDLVLARAEAMLDVPPGVTLELDAPTLVASGAAPPPWIVSTRDDPPEIPGVERVDVSGVTMDLPQPLVDGANRVRGAVVTFAIGSAALTPAGQSTLDSVSQTWFTLAPLASEHAVVAVLETVGRSDATGSAAVNQGLSERRAQAVRAALVGRGVPDARIVARGVGTADPVRAGDAQRAAELNRSVSFDIHYRLRSQ